MLSRCMTPLQVGKLPVVQQNMVLDYHRASALTVSKRHNMGLVGPLNLLDYHIYYSTGSFRLLLVGIDNCCQ